jgi:hypothetical protein
MANNGGLRNILAKVFRGNGGHWLRQTGVPRLQELSGELQRLNAATEEEFLLIGGYLQDFAGRAKEISEGSEATARMIGGVELNQAIAQLGHISQHTQLLESECERGTDILTDILGTLDLVQTSITGFTKIVKTLAVLGTFIRVESARLHSMDTDFSTLATEINQLGQDIEEKYKNIYAKSHSLSSEINSSLANVLNIKAIQKNQLHLVIDKTMVSLESLTAKHTLSSTTITDIVSNYQNISKNISDIIISLQFHDITRQQIEHVESALQNILPLLQEKSRQNGEARGALMLAKDICQIQEAQLSIARDKLTQAVGSIIGDLKSIARDIRAISQQVQELVGGASREGGSFLAEMEEYLAAVAAGLHHYGAARQDLAGLMAAVVPAVADMAAFLLDIERIEIAIERIALNACIKAAHLGGEGDVLGVLAEATQNLVGETRQQTQAVAASLKSIKAAAHQLAAGPDAVVDQPEVDVAALVTNLGEVLKTLDRVNENAISSLTRVDQKGKSLSAEILEASGAITVHEYAGATLSQVMAGIMELSRQFEGHLPEENRLTALGQEELVSLKAQYTMRDERLAHDQALTSSPTPVAKAMLPVEHKDLTTVAANEKVDDDNLGDNVELF